MDPGRDFDVIALTRCYRFPAAHALRRPDRDEAWNHRVYGKCANRAGLNVIDIVLEPLASAEATLQDDERDLGVALIDIGGGTTDLAVFCDGSIKHTSGLGLGG